jgi:hypothetical protein
MFMASLEMEIEQYYHITTTQFALILFLYSACDILFSPISSFWANAQGRR